MQYSRESSLQQAASLFLWPVDSFIDSFVRSFVYGSTRSCDIGGGDGHDGLRLDSTVDYQVVLWSVMQKCCYRYPKLSSVCVIRVTVPGGAKTSSGSVHK